MSEAEIINKLKERIRIDRSMRLNVESDFDRFCEEECRAIEGLIDLYNKEKEKNKELEEYANWHIEHLTEDIADYIDDDRKANASLIGELKEEREHWKDIIRISNNEKTYIDYKNY